MKIGKVAPSTVNLPKQFSEPGKFAISRDVSASLLADRSNLWIFLSSLILIFSQIGLISLYFGKLPPEIPIFYSMTWGDGIIGKNVFLWFLPLIAVITFLLNFTIFFIFFRDNKFLSKVLFWSSTLVSFATLWGSMKIVTLLV